MVKKTKEMDAFLTALIFYTFILLCICVGYLIGKF